MIFFLLLSISTAFAQIELAITVDDLPVHMDLPKGTTRLEVAEKMLKVLKKHQVPEVYGFINAVKLENEPETRKVLEAWIEAGYPLGNHVYSHPDLVKTDIETYQKEIAQNEPLLKELSGTQNWKVFRYPYLHEGDSIEKRSAIRKYLADHQYQIAQVTVDFNDWAWNRAYARCKDKNDQKQLKWMKKTYFESADWNLQRDLKISEGLYQRPIKHILLLHIGAFTADQLDDLLTDYKKQGVRFIPLSEAMKDPIYTFDPSIISRGGDEFIYQVLQARGLKADQFDSSPKWEHPRKKLDNLCL